MEGRHSEDTRLEDRNCQTVCKQMTCNEDNSSKKDQDGILDLETSQNKKETDSEMNIVGSELQDKIQADTGVEGNGKLGDVIVIGKLCDGDGDKKEKRPPRSERKRRYHEQLLQQQRENRKRKKMERKMQGIQGSSADDVTECQMAFKAVKDKDVTKKVWKEVTKRRAEEGLKIGQKVCIDCSLEHLMSVKEISKLAMQIGRVYGSNRQARQPAHLYLTGLRKGGQLYQECIRKNSGFENYMLKSTEKTHTELFPVEQLVYLTPDSDTPLTDIDQDKVYILGGLVDENVAKHVTSSKAAVSGIATCCLPIEEHMEKTEQESFSKVLAINNVFEILMEYQATKSWSTALGAGVPKRKGYVVKDS